MDNPTHADAFLNLLSSCFPTCRSNGPAAPPSPQLGALLRDAESDDAMSLHSTYRPHTRQKKKKSAMQLCGINLFGKPRGQIRLEDDDNEPPFPRPRYDSDAAPLPDSTIQSLSTPTTEQPTRHESPEEELARLRAEKAARKARKRERKLKRQLALEQAGEFEGFIGSGEAFPISPPSTTTSTPGIEDMMSDRGSTRFGSDRSARLVDVDPEDEEADMGAAVYTRSTRSRSESGSSATRSSRAREEGLVPGNALGLRGPPSPLVQEYIPEVREPEPEPEPVESQPKPATLTETKPARPKPRIHISDIPLSSPGAGPGPRTLENSPRLAGLETPRQTEGYFVSPRLGSSSNLALDSPRHAGPDTPKLAIPRPVLALAPSGFPSPGLSRSKAPSGLGKSVGSGPGLGLNCTSPGSGRTNADGRELVVHGGRDGSESAFAGGNVIVGRTGDVFHANGGRSGDAGSQRSSGDSDGCRSYGHDQGGSGSGNGHGNGNGTGGEWKGRVTPQMGVALANRGGE
ncbi:hypothetical protein ACGC1H_002116 [Rhizoctonia solani]